MVLPARPRVAAAVVQERLGHVVAADVQAAEAAAVAEFGLNDEQRLVIQAIA